MSKKDFKSAGLKYDNESPVLFTKRRVLHQKQLSLNVRSISANEDSSSVIVLLNRNMKRETVRDAIANTLAFSGMAANEQLKYYIYWGDSQRFVVRFTNLTAENAVQFRLDDVQAETGEYFASKSQKNRNHATLKGRS